MAKRESTKNILLSVPRGAQSGRLEWSGILRYAAKKRDWRILSPPYNPLDLATHINEAFDNGEPIDGLIATDQTLPQLRTRRWQKSGVRVVTLDSKPDGKADAALIADDAEVARTAAEFLMKRGYRHFAYVKCNPALAMVEHSDARAAAFVRRIVQAGFEATLVEDDENLQQSIRRLPKPVGVLAYNDYTANDVLDACRLTHVAVPKQLGLVGVDNDVSICENLRPSLTSIQLDFEMAGYQAAQLLDRLLSGKSAKDRRFGVRTLIERDSTRDFSSAGRLVAAARQIIRERFREKLTSDVIAAELRVSARLLQIRFKEIAECGIHEEIVRRRLDAAEELLRTTNDPMKSISVSCGFPGIEHFYRLFRQRYGKTPQSWRTAASGV